MKKIELLAPAGNMDKLKTALYFGADAVYVGGKAFSLRASADNFDNAELREAVEYTHALGKKLYVTVNIFAKNKDFDKIREYCKYLRDIGVDAVIVSDPGVISLIRSEVEGLEIHLSTQANTTNSYSMRFWASQGVARVVVARELTLEEISQMHEQNPEVEIEAFVHGAMCISYSGRCLMSNYLTHRDSNRGECVQACRWNFRIREVTRHEDTYLEMEEDERGTYIFNSKDLNMSARIHDMVRAGVVSMKIEGRMKSEYYLATVVNAYRHAIDEYYESGEEYTLSPIVKGELEAAAHRDYTEAYADGDNLSTVTYDNSQLDGDCIFVAKVIEGHEGYAEIEMRNRFVVGDVLEVLSPSDSFLKEIVVDRVETLEGEKIEDCKYVQQRLYLYTAIPLNAGDILRKRR